MLTGSKAAPAIQFENVSIRYRVPRERLSGIKEFTIRWLQRRIQFQDFWALRGVSFSIQVGEVFGIIGRNGAGKSTMLKVMAQVLRPVEGRLITRGKVAPLLELGGGFHPELTGRENVYLNMALLGHPRKSTEALFESIVTFSGLPDFIDAPLRTYSTGMVARLGFAVATCIRPDILLVDEILSVGDSQFQQKCLDRMFEFQQQGTTIVIVSHGLGALETLCQRALLLEKGQVKLIGPVEQVIQEYIAEDKPNIEPTLGSDRVPAAEPAHLESSNLEPVVKPVPAPLPNGEYVSLDEVGGIYPAQDIFVHEEGTVTVWFKIDSEQTPRDCILFHTDDSRYVLYISLQYSTSQKRYIRKLVARAGGNRRVIDTYYGTSDFPEVSVAIEETEGPKKHILSEGEWHQIAMTWKGYPDGKVCLYADGVFLGEKIYDSRFDRGDRLPGSISIGLRPSIWTGEIIQQADGQVQEFRPSTLMWIGEAGLEMKDLRLYRRALSGEEIQNL